MASPHLCVPAASVKGSSVTSRGMLPSYFLPVSYLPPKPGVKLLQPELGERLCALQPQPCSWPWVSTVPVVGMGLGWPALGQASHSDQDKADAGGAFGLGHPCWEEKCPVAPAVRDWWWLRGSARCPLPVSPDTLLGTARAIFVGCLLSAYAGPRLRQLVAGPAPRRRPRCAGLATRLRARLSSCFSCSSVCAGSGRSCRGSADVSPVADGLFPGALPRSPGAARGDAR